MLRTRPGLLPWEEARAAFRMMCKPGQRLYAGPMAWLRDFAMRRRGLMNYQFPFTVPVVMYSGSLLLFLGIPLLLGSGYGLLFALGGMLLLAWRTVMEERMLRAELAGYEDYMQQVKYRLIPALW